MDKNKWPKLNQIVEQDSQEQEGFGVLTQEDSSIQTSITLDNIAGGLSQPKANDSLAPGKEATEVNTQLTDLDKGGNRKTPNQLDEEDFMNFISDQSKSSNMENDCQGWQSPKTRKTKKKKYKKNIVVATRTSSRVPRDGIPVAIKATNRAIAKNTITGTTSNPNPFNVLNNTSNDHLEKVILDLDIEVEDIEGQIDVFRTEELARAAIAEANYKVFLEK
jgi:hypothetical protein